MALSFEARSRLEARVSASILSAKRDPQGYERRVARWLWLGENLCALAGFLAMIRGAFPSAGANFAARHDREEARAQSALVETESKQTSSSSDGLAENCAWSATGEVTRYDAPALFAMIDELCAQADIDVPISVFLVPGSMVVIDVEFCDTSKVRDNGSGRRKWRRFAQEQKRARLPRVNRPQAKLSLGRTMLETVGVDELRAILAHELGHIVGRQTHLSNRCKILDRRLGNIGSPATAPAAPALLAQSQSPLSADPFEKPNLLALLIGAVIYRLKRALWVQVFPVFRNAEFEADCFAASMVGSKVFAAALIRISVTDKRNTCYLPSLINELDEQEIGCAADPLDERVLKLLLGECSDPNISHPCLSERLDWINAAPAAPPPVTVPAQTLLGKTPARSLT